MQGENARRPPSGEEGAVYYQHQGSTIIRTGSSDSASASNQSVNPDSPSETLDRKPSGKKSTANDEFQLPEDFTPGDDDVVCGRGKRCYSHVGNLRFVERVSSVLDEYSSAKSKLEKTSVLERVVDAVRQHSPSGGFVKQNQTTGRWYEVGDFIAKEKTSQAFRDALHGRYKSSNQSKKKRRQDELAKASHNMDLLASQNRRAELLGQGQGRIDQLSHELRDQDFFHVQSQAGLLFSPTISQNPQQMYGQRQRLQQQQTSGHFSSGPLGTTQRTAWLPSSYAPRHHADPLFGGSLANDPNITPEDYLDFLPKRKPLPSHVPRNYPYGSASRQMLQREQELLEIERMHQSAPDIFDASFSHTSFAHDHLHDDEFGRHYRSEPNMDYHHEEMTSQERDLPGAPERLLPPSATYQEKLSATIAMKRDINYDPIPYVEPKKFPAVGTTPRIAKRESSNLNQFEPRPISPGAQRRQLSTADSSRRKIQPPERNDDLYFEDEDSR